MAITRDLQDASRVTDWTEEVNEIPNQFGLVNSMGLFSSEGIASTSVVFDRSEHEIKLLSQTNRGQRGATTGGQKSTETFALSVPFYKHEDAINSQDVQNFRMIGTADQAANVEGKLAEKMMFMRERFDQTVEYLKIQALKGLIVDPSTGNTVVDMFNEYGLTQNTVDFELGTTTTQIDLKIQELKTVTTKSAKVGASIGKIFVLCDQTFFNRLTTHPVMREAYRYYQNNQSQLLRDDLSQYQAWGITETFEHKGVMFMSYDADFTLADGTPVTAFGANEGFTVVSGIRDAYKGYFSPSDKLADVNSPGAESYFYEYIDPRGSRIDLEMQSGPLFFLKRPQLSTRVHSSN